MRRRNVCSIGMTALFVICFCTAGAYAGFIDFENGIDGMPIASSIPGLEFTNTAGYDWVYGDWRTGSYNGPYPAGRYYSDGNFFAWLGTDQGAGVISFTQSYATYFKIGYSSYSNFFVEAYDDQGTLLDSDFGLPNLDTGIMNYLRVDAPGMAYVVCHDTGNYWLVDNLETDAIQQCTLDIHCDDGVYCNGLETCVNWMCEDGVPIECEDDGSWCNGEEVCDEETQQCKSETNAELRCPDDEIFCNGDEYCDEDAQACMHTGDPCEDDGLFCNGEEVCDEEFAECASTGNPCEEGECDEETDSCYEDPDEPDLEDKEDDEDEIPEGDEELWPEGKVTGGCGCG